MYIGLYVSVTNRFPKLLEQDTTEKRNNAIHGSEIPSEDQALRILEDIRSCIKEAINSLHPLHQDYSTGLEAGKRAKEAFEKSNIVLKSPPQFIYMGSQIDAAIRDKIKYIRDETKYKSVLRVYETKNSGGR